MNFLTKRIKAYHEFKKKGYVIINAIKNLDCLNYIQKKIINSELKLNKKEFNSQSF